MLPVEQSGRRLDVDLILGVDIPGQFQTGIQIAPHHTGLLRAGMEFAQLAHLRSQLFLGLIIERERLDLLEVLICLIVDVVPLAQLFGNGTLLLPEIVLPLVLVDLLLDLGVEFPLQSEDIDLPFQQRSQQLQALGIEADLIVMHPYDRWGFSMMKAEDDDRYWKYVLARFSAYRNVWWSLANEYDLMHEKTLADWERYAAIICEKDPYHHLRSIHNCKAYYDYNLPWVTHCSIQRTETYRSSELVNEWREKYHKPVVLDEICYEGNIQFGWGNISGEEMTRRFWEAFCRGGYPGHGETYLSPDRILWWSHGGVLHGTSPERIKFLAKIMEETPGLGVEPMPCKWDEVACRAAGFPARKDYFIYYYTFMRPSFRDFYFDDTTEYQVEIIDTWEMTITDGGIHKGQFRVQLPGKEYIAVRIKAVK